MYGIKGRTCGSRRQINDIKQWQLGRSAETIQQELEAQYMAIEELKTQLKSCPENN